MIKCLLCKKDTSNPKFCSRSCAASYNNKKDPKRKPEHKCLDCGKPITANRARCKEHYLIWLKDKEVLHNLKHFLLVQLQWVAFV